MLVYNFLYKNSKFAIGVNKLTVAQQNKIRIGGIKALNNLMFGNDNVENISFLVDKLLQKYTNPDNIPLANIILIIATFKIRQQKTFA